MSHEAYTSDMLDEPPTFTLGVSRLREVEAPDLSAEMDDDGLVWFSTGNPSVQQFEGHLRLAVNKDAGPARGRQLCVLAVPRYMSIADFYRFVGSHIEHVLHMRIVQSENPERYMALVDLDSEDSALEMYTECNGKPYSSMDTERCIVVFVAAVNFLDDKQPAPPSASPPPTGSSPPSHAPVAAREGGGSGGDSLKGTPFASHECLTELPSCPVCLERLDMSVTGIMTTICNHSFHCRCLSDWPDTSCPVCRYCQQPEPDQVCSICMASNDLWMCVICGFVGCGRYIGEHALEHYRDTGHSFSIELTTQRVWDYSGDNYVHRLVASKVDGKLVELPDNAGGMAA
eukprot:CAMPEP_0169429814 /NCGR_PEP_ID=MMETSP1042-20121227/2064_1 /TAXON_ID=464988 /ORGANISM="Hemiselmis andersenii, Strain CCMP1180" /LENGTH=343 /DNA_ID=CAMNT_0009540083 /DNA_START=11 /DNA_END=1038 /DNA_ORIENTATION=+